MEQNKSYGVSSGGVLGGGVTGGSVTGGGTTVSTEPVSQTPPVDDPPAEVKPSDPKPDNKPKPKPSVETTEPDGQGEPAADDGGEGSPTDDSEPHIPDITEDDGSGSGEWCGNDEDTTTGKGDFFDENKELIKKLKYVLEFVYPDSGIDLAKLLTGGKGYIAMFAGGGKPSGSDTTPSPDDPAPITDPIVTSPPSGQPKPAGQTTPTEQTQPVQTPPQPDSIVTEDELDRIIDAYNEINNNTDARYKKYAKNKVTIVSQIGTEERKNTSKRDLLKNAIARLEEYVLNRCGKKIVNLVDIVDILMYIHDFLAETVIYDLSSDDKSNELWGCLADPKSNGVSSVRSACRGYSEAFVFLCCYVNCVNSKNRSAITVDYCPYTVYKSYDPKKDKYMFVSDPSENHIFNCVKIDGKWYYIDSSDSNRAGQGALGEVKSPPYGYEHRNLLTGDVDSYNKKVLNGNNKKIVTIVGAPEETLVVPSGNKEKRTLKSSGENLYYDHLFTKHNSNSDKMKKDYLGKNQEMAKNYKCSFIDDIVMINNDIEKSSKDYCIHVAFVIRGDKPETAPYRVGKKEENIPLIYYYLIDLAKSGKKVLAEIVYKDGLSKSEVKSMYSNNSQYIINLFEQSNSDSAASLGVHLEEQSFAGSDYYVATIYFIRKPKGSS